MCELKESAIFWPIRHMHIGTGCRHIYNADYDQMPEQPFINPFGIDSCYNGGLERYYIIKTTGQEYEVHPDDVELFLEYMKAATYDR